MAVASPMTINTSSPRSFRIPSITPPSLGRHSKKTESSSPGLPSPSTFVKPQSTTLKTGSKAQPPPDGVKIGFASAGSLWRDKQFAVEQYGFDDATRCRAVQRKAGDVAKDDSKSKHKPGGLVKPTKASKRPDTEESKVKSPLLRDFGYREIDAPKRDNAFQDVEPDVYDVPEQDSPGGASPFFQLSNNDLKDKKIEKTEEQPQLAVIKPPQPAKKPCKKAAKRAEGVTPKTKQTRKKKAKSEAIILNSDESEQAIDKRTDKVSDVTLNDAQVKNALPVEPSAQPAFLSSKSVVRPSFQALQERPIILQQALEVDKRITYQHDPAAEQSSYFVKPAIPKQPLGDSRVLQIESVPDNYGHEHAQIIVDEPDITSFQFAPSRKREWTPVRDTEQEDALSRPQTAGSESSETSNMPRPQLSDILGKYSYTSADTYDATGIQREEDGEAAVKRRRIEPEHHAKVIESPTKQSKKTKAPKPPKPAKVVKVPKKARTVTAAATAAFKPQKEVEVDQTVVSAFFVASENKGALPESAAFEQALERPTAAKSKKPRKPRAKTKAPIDGAELPNANGKPNVITTVKKKKSVKIKEPQPVPKLYTPSQATAEIRKQDFLFGTSSQLAPAESPEFVRSMQTALRASERIQGDHEDTSAMSPPPTSALLASAKNTSYTRIATAPHGTCLSIRQADRELWAVAARDVDGLVLPVEESSAILGNLDGGAELEPIPTITDALSDDLRSVEAELSDCKPVLQVNGHEGEEWKTSSLEHTEIDICNNPVDLEIKHKAAEAVDDDDSWMILHSDASVSVPEQVSRVIPEVPLPSPSPTALSIAPKPPSLITSPSSRMFRRALHPLDSNAMIMAQTSSDKASSSAQIRALSSTTNETLDTAKRPRGRPRKDADLVSRPNASPKKRGRPQKASVAASSPPRSKTKASKASASQPMPQSEWLDIDEIQDSDSPSTPSPPRRRATSSPPVVRPLVLSPSGSQEMGSKAPVVSTAQTVRPDGPQWPATKETLFPKLTMTVKSEPHNGDPKNLSWWEKILMYDPIVVEDLTAWLNGQGLRVDVRKPRPKSKGKKRKADGEAEKEKETNEADYEIHAEALQPWMVQKWCQEKSICCYLRDSGWRGKRQH